MVAAVKKNTRQRLAVKLSTLPIGTKLEGERSLAETLGCSRVVLRDIIKEMSQNGVLATLPKQGTFLVNHPDIASNVESENEKDRLRIGLVVIKSTIGNDCAAMIEGIQEFIAGSVNCVISLWILDNSKLKQEKYTAPLLGCDAYIIMGDYLANDLVFFLNQRRPLLIFGNIGDEFHGALQNPLVRVYVDERASCRNLIHSLWQMGYRRPSIFVGSTHRAYLDRIDGFNEGLLDMGQRPEEFLKFIAAPEILRGEVPKRVILEKAREVLAAHAQYDCLITTSFEEIIGELHLNGISRSEQFPLVADSNAANSFSEVFGITEVTVNCRNAGRIGMEKLLECIGFSQKQFAIPLIRELIVRTSCKTKK